jgi:hypothetical protein
MIFLETKRLFLRSHQVGDEEEFIRMQTDAEVSRHMLEKFGFRIVDRTEIEGSRRVLLLYELLGRVSG